MPEPQAALLTCQRVTGKAEMHHLMTLDKERLVETPWSRRTDQRSVGSLARGSTPTHTSCMPGSTRRRVPGVSVPASKQCAASRRVMSVSEPTPAALLAPPERPRGRCGSCPSYRWLTKAGLIPKHQRPADLYGRRYPCAGGGQPPRTEAGEQRD